MTIYEKRMNALNEAIARRNARNPYRKEPIKITKRCERCGEWFEGYMGKYCEECKKEKVKEDSRRYWEKVRSGEITRRPPCKVEREKKK